MSTPRTPYQVCVECGTEYASAAALLAAHDQQFTPGPHWLSFCPECMHDFMLRPGGQVDLVGHAAVLAECLRRNGFDPAHAVERHVIKLQEEAGEVAGAYLRSTGQARRSGTTEELHEEVADVILTACSLAHHLRMNLNAVITAKLDKIHTRGWRSPCDHPTGTHCTRCIDSDPEYQAHADHWAPTPECPYCPDASDPEKPVTTTESEVAA